MPTPSNVEKNPYANVYCTHLSSSLKKHQSAKPQNLSVLSLKKKLLPSVQHSQREDYDTPHELLIDCLKKIFTKEIVGLFQQIVADAHLHGPVAHNNFI